MNSLTLALLVTFHLKTTTGIPQTTSIFSDDDESRIRHAKMEMWKRGGFDLDETNLCDGGDDVADCMERRAVIYTRSGPVRKSRSGYDRSSSSAGSFWGGVPRGGGNNAVGIEDRLKVLGETYGPEFTAAIEKNRADHDADCTASCDNFYCATEEKTSPSWSMESNLNGTTFASYSFGGVPPEDFSDQFGFPLDLIKVSQDRPLFPPTESQSVITIAESEGLSQNEYQSGKYKLGGDWLVNLPLTREWFNEQLRSTLFPLLTGLFPEIVSSEKVLRAHSVSLLKYNSSHPRTDVHIDNGVLAMTLAMTPKKEYSGGGTFFEHMGVDNILEMDVGHGTFRPGSVRHGGNRVTRGVRYILGAFLLIEDRVEHVRRLKNRGSQLRVEQDLDGAAKHFEWALAINPKCCTCLKDWAEVLQTQRQYEQAEQKIRAVLTLLENRDSDALFTLGLLLSEQQKDDESIAAYEASVALNAEDAELCYNLGLKYAQKGAFKKETDMYARTLQIDPNFGGAWINWGTSLAEREKYDDAESKFRKAMECCPDVAPKAMMNLALTYIARGNRLMGLGDVESAKQEFSKAGESLDAAKPLLEGSKDVEAATYLAQYKSLRMTCHRNVGRLFTALRQMDECEEEFKRAVENFPEDAMAWDMLGRILDFVGKKEEAGKAKEKMKMLMAATGSFAA